MAEAAADTAAPSARRDPEEVAIELLGAQLGATAIDRADRGRTDPRERYRKAGGPASAWRSR